jgi:2-polyprenyl-3-methyl-5-hydroxy-6-metoxy-1,4-benzoquinol methylase
MSYVIRGGEAGRARLGVLGRALHDSTAALLERAGIRPGMRCLDLGCGGGDVTLPMAAMVAPDGIVVGIDMDDVKIDLARQEAVERGVANVNLRTGDATALCDVGRYDLVYARFLLTHLPDPQATVSCMVDAAVPGGVVAVEDIQHSSVFAYPASPFMERYVELYDEVVRRRGCDPDIGPRLPGMLRRGRSRRRLGGLRPADVRDRGGQAGPAAHA